MKDKKGEDSSKSLTAPTRIERVTIGENVREKLSCLTEQANTSLDGVATVTKSDIVNLLLEEAPTHLLDSQIAKLRHELVDDLKYATWIANRLKAARAAGHSLNLDDLLRRRSEFGAAEKKADHTQKPRRVKARSPLNEAVSYGGSRTEDNSDSSPREPLTDELANGDKIGVEP